MRSNVQSIAQSVAQELSKVGTGQQAAAHRCRCGRPLPSSPAVAEITKTLRGVLFPGHFGDEAASAEGKAAASREGGRRNNTDHVSLAGRTLERIRAVLAEQIQRALCYASTQETKNDCAERADCAHSITDSFLSRLPSVREILSTDVQAAYDGDPAATSTHEAILCYPGVLAMTNYRLAHELHVLHVPLIPRMITERAHSETGIDIHPGAEIGEGFFIDHGTGVVIGETCIIGKHVRIYQGVTLGAKSFPLDHEGKPVKGIDRHPIVEDDVIIYSGATILGRVVIGRESVIGGNVWLTHGVPPGSRVSQAEIVQDVFDRGAGI
jgi:serine O-acetyltransferase